MKTYDTYKPSGIEWIGDIPEHWEVKKLKWIISDKLKYGANEIAELDDPNLPRYIRITDFGEDGKLKDDTFKSLPNEIAKDYLLDEGDILFARSGATVGKTFQFKDYKGFACFAGYLIRAKPNKEVLNSDFMYFYTKSWGYESWKNSIFNQATIQNIGADKYAYLEFIIPSYTEQTSIGTYLDRKTAEIDHIIANKQKLIALYEEEKQTIINQAVTRGVNKTVKLKPSGVEWLGNIPEHWDRPCIRHICQFVLDGTHGSYPRVSIGYRLLSVRNIINDEFVFRDDDSKVSEEHYVEISKRFLIKENDIQLAIVGATLGKVAVVKSLPETFVTQRSVATLRTNEQCIPYFLFYFLKTTNFQSYLWLNAGFSAQPGVYLGTIQSSYIPLPKAEEQESIVVYIKQKCSHLDTLIEKLKKQIELFQEYRTTLISEVVTGKVKVIE